MGYHLRMTYNLLKSRTFYTVLLMFIVGGGNAIVPVLSPDLQTILTGILGIAAAYFHLDLAQRTGATN